MTTERKALPSSPTVTAVTVKNGKFEATIRDGDGITFCMIGPKGGRSNVVSMSQGDTELFLALVETGRATLARMQALG